MAITRHGVAGKIAAYLHHEIDLAALVDWSENAMMNETLETDDVRDLSEVIARLGVADVRAFGLTWEDCESLLGQLGYKARVEIVTN